MVPLILGNSHIGPFEQTVLWSQEPNVLRFCFAASDLPILVVDHNPVPKTVPKPQQEPERSHKVMVVEWLSEPGSLFTCFLDP